MKLSRAMANTLTTHLTSTQGILVGQTRTMRALERRGLAFWDSISREGQTWGHYRITPKGREALLAHDSSKGATRPTPVQVEAIRYLVDNEGWSVLAFSKRTVDALVWGGYAERGYGNRAGQYRPTQNARDFVHYLDREN